MHFLSGLLFCCSLVVIATASWFVFALLRLRDVSVSDKAVDSPRPFHFCFRAQDDVCSVAVAVKACGVAWHCTAVSRTLSLSLSLTVSTPWATPSSWLSAAFAPQAMVHRQHSRQGSTIPTPMGDTSNVTIRLSNLKGSHPTPVLPRVRVFRTQWVPCWRVNAVATAAADCRR